MFGISSVWKGACAAIGAVLLIVGVVKGCSAIDARKAAKHDAKIVSAAAHQDTASTFISRADTAHTRGAALRTALAEIVSSPAVRADTLAVKVAEAGGVVIASADTEIAAVRTANLELQAEARDLRTAGTAPSPRASIYLDPLVSFRADEKPLPLVRAGVDYRLLGRSSIKLELAYDPGAAAPKHLPIVLSVGLHLALR